MSDDYNYAERKTVILLASNVEPAIALNVVGHLALAIGAYAPEGAMGRSHLTDASGIRHTGISRYPVIVLKGRASKVRTALEAARAVDDLLLVDYPREMLTTGHDDELSEAIASKEESDFEYLGIAAHGETNKIDELFRKFTLWRMD